MADDEVFNVTALCEIADIDDVAKAVCAVNDALASTKIGLDTFFLIFGVSPRRNFLLLTFGGMNPLLCGVMDDLLAWIVCVRFVIADCYSLFGRDFPLSDGQPHGPQRRLVSITRAAEWPLAFTRDKCMVARTRRRLTSGTVVFPWQAPSSHGTWCVTIQPISFVPPRVGKTAVSKVPKHWAELCRDPDAVC